MSWPTADHVLYIPAMLLIGAVVGYILGVRAARAELDKKRRRERQ